ncbi:MAG: hypothetical protein ACXVD0_02385 [Nocardioides sp.]
MTRTTSRTHLVRRAVAGGALVPLALFSVVSCGDKNGAATDANAASSGSPSASTSSTSGSSTPSAGASVDPADFVARFSDGFAHTTTAHETMTMTLGASGNLTGEGDVDYSSGSPSMSMSMKSAQESGRLEIRLVDRTMYMTIPGMAGGKFIKMNLDDPNSPFGSMGVQLDPADALKTFAKGITGVTYVGTEGALGHYRVTVDSKKMMAELGSTAGQAALDALPPTLTYDVWLDDQDRVNKMTMDMGTSGTMEMELSDFGKDVHVEAPPASQVTTMPGM